MKKFAERFKCFNPLTYTEREQIKILLNAGFSPHAIAKEIGRAKNTIYYEFRRFDNLYDYDPDKAHQDFLEKQKLVGIKKINSTQAIIQ
jgi:IS30 family transposase